MKILDLNQLKMYYKIIIAVWLFVVAFVPNTNAQQVNSTIKTLQNFYIGDDKGAYYTSQNKDKVYIYAEHPKRYSIVFTGKKTKHTIRGDWYSVSKYKSKKSGTVELKIITNNAIEVVKQTGGFPSKSLKYQKFTPLIREQFLEPKDPAYSSYDNKDLTGAFQGDEFPSNGLPQSNNKITCYCRQIGKVRVVMFCESAFKRGKIPLRAYTFVGKRIGNKFSGEIAFVSKGVSKGFGKATFQINNDQLTSTGNIFIGMGNWNRVYPDYTKNINDYIAKLKYDKVAILKLNKGGNTKKKIGGSSEKTEDLGDNAALCNIQTWDYRKNIGDMVNIGGIDIQPGDIVKINQDFVKGNPVMVTAIPLKANSFKNDLPGLPSKKTKFRAYSDQFSGKLNDQLRWWNNNSYKEGYRNAANSELIMKEAWSKKQLAIDLGLNYRTLGGSVSTDFSYTSTSTKYIFYAFFKQVFYTVKVNQPKTPADWFLKKTTLIQVKKNFTAKTPLGYVSSVKYGRLMKLTVEISTKESFSDAKAAVKWLVGGGSLSGSTNIKHKNIIKNSSIHAQVYGGAPIASSLGTAANPPKELAQFIKKYTTYKKNNPGLPIEYTVKFIKDNSVAKIGLAAKYDEAKCEIVESPVIRLKHKGGYMAKFYVWWDEGSTRKEYSSGSKPVGWSHVLRLPVKAKNIRVKTQALGVKWKTIDDRNVQFGCKVSTKTGTIWGAGVNVNCPES